MEDTRNEKFEKFCYKLPTRFPAAKTLTLFLTMDLYHAQDVAENPAAFPWVTQLRKTPLSSAFDLQLHLRFTCCSTITNLFRGEENEFVTEEIQSRYQLMFQDLLLPTSLFQGGENGGRDGPFHHGIEEWCCKLAEERMKGHGVQLCLR